MALSANQIDALLISANQARSQSISLETLLSVLYIIIIIQFRLVNSYRSANRIRRSGSMTDRHNHHVNQSIREAIARMDPFFLSGRERFILNKIMRKGAHKVTEPRIYQAFDEINPTQEEMEAFTDLTQQLLSKATSEDAVRLALVGLDDSTVFVDGFFSEEKRLEGLRQASMIEGLVEQEQNKIEHDVHLKMGNEPVPDIPKGKGRTSLYFKRSHSMYNF